MSQLWPAFGRLFCDPQPRRLPRHARQLRAWILLARTAKVHACAKRILLLLRDYVDD